MSNEFRPVEAKPARGPWPFVALGAVVAALLVWAGHRSATVELPKTAAAQARAALADAPPAQAAEPELKLELPKTEPARTAQVQAAAAPPAPVAARAPESPNVLGTAAAATGRIPMVARTELDRELARTRAAQKEAAGLRAQLEDLQRQLGAARAQLAAQQRSSQPPPPSDRDQILQVLAPVLKAGNGRP